MIMLRCPEIQCLEVIATKTALSALQTINQAITGEQTDGKVFPNILSAVKDAIKTVVALKSSVEQIDGIRKLYYVDSYNTFRQPQPPISIPGLRYLEVPKDGHCLYHAVGKYLNIDQKNLRARVAQCIRDNEAVFKDAIVLPKECTWEKYIADINDGKKYAENLDIAVLMRVFNRPIIIVGPNSKIRQSGFGEIEKQYPDEPIFIYYNGVDHYNALILDGTLTSNSILTNLRTFSSKQKVPSVRLSQDINPPGTLASSLSSSSSSASKSPEPVPQTPSSSSPSGNSDSNSTKAGASGLGDSVVKDDHGAADRAASLSKTDSSSTTTSALPKSGSSFSSLSSGSNLAKAGASGSGDFGVKDANGAGSLLSKTDSDSSSPNPDPSKTVPSTIPSSSESSNSSEQKPPKPIPQTPSSSDLNGNSDSNLTKAGASEPGDSVDEGDLGVADRAASLSKTDSSSTTTSALPKSGSSSSSLSSGSNLAKASASRSGDPVVTDSLGTVGKSAQLFSRTDFKEKYQKRLSEIAQEIQVAIDKIDSLQAALLLNFKGLIITRSLLVAKLIQEVLEEVKKTADLSFNGIDKELREKVKELKENVIELEYGLEEKSTTKGCCESSKKAPLLEKSELAVDKGKVTKKQEFQYPLNSCCCVESSRNTCCCFWSIKGIQVEVNPPNVKQIEDIGHKLSTAKAALYTRQARANSMEAYTVYASAILAGALEATRMLVDGLCGRNPTTMTDGFDQWMHYIAIAVPILASGVYKIAGRCRNESKKYLETINEQLKNPALKITLAPNISEVLDVAERGEVTSSSVSSSSALVPAPAPR